LAPAIAAWATPVVIRATATDAKTVWECAILDHSFCMANAKSDGDPFQIIFRLTHHAHFGFLHHLSQDAATTWVQVLQHAPAKRPNAGSGWRNWLW